MKIRQGFVSNSSTSSFVMIGVKLSESEIDSLFEDYLNVGAYDDSNPYSDKSEYIESLGLFNPAESEHDSVYGKELCVWSYEDYPSISLSIEDMERMSQEICKKLNVSSDRVKLYIGTMSC